MTSLTNDHQKLILTYFIFVFLITIILIIINPIPLIRGDLWAEDGRFYLAETFRVGFWDALKVNFTLKGYPQLLKYLLSYLSIIMNQIFVGENLLYYPHISAVISYLTYSLVFALPILLFSSFMDRKSLYAMPTLLISLFLTFSLLSQSFKKGFSMPVNHVIWSVIVSLILFNGIHANQMPKVSTIPIEESFSLAQPGREDGAIIKILNVDSENRRIYELPM